MPKVQFIFRPRLGTIRFHRWHGTLGEILRYSIILGPLEIRVWQDVPTASAEPGE